MAAKNTNPYESERTADYFRRGDADTLLRLCTYLRAINHQKSKGFMSRLGGSAFVAVAQILEDHIIPWLRQAEADGELRS